MFKWTFRERENIVESRPGLHLSLHGLDVEIMAIKVPVKQIQRATVSLASDWLIMCQKSVARDLFLPEADFAL